MKMKDSWALLGAIVAALAVAAMLVPIAMSPTSWASDVGLIVFYAVGAFCAAGLLGFLFGVPRSAASPDTSTVQRFSPNTNLEQISDWLTKVLLGATLTQLQPVGHGVRDLVAWLGSPVGPSLGAPLVAAILCVFGVLGFVAGWLLTRLLLGAALAKADELAVSRLLLDQAAKADQQGNPSAARSLALAAADASQRASDVGTNYDWLRATMSPGTARTRRMLDVWQQMLQEARRASAPPPRQDVLAQLQDGSDSERLRALAWMIAFPEVLDIPAIATAVVAPRSRFEQYQSLRAIQVAIETEGLEMTADDRQLLLGAIADASASLDSGQGDRRALADRIRVALLGASS